MNRRELLLAGGAAVTGMAARGLPHWWAPDDQAKKRRILAFTKSSGFEHSVVKRKGTELGFAEQILTDLGTKHGFEVTCTKDGGVFTADNLATYDAFFFYTTGDLTQPGTDKNPPMTVEGKRAFLDAIRKGKGFIGTHAAADTFHTPPELPDRATRYVDHGDQADPYIRMIGAEFIKHGKQQTAKMRLIDPKFPGFAEASDVMRKAFPNNVTDFKMESFDLMEEWYSFHDYSPDLHVLLVQETMGMEGKEYQRAPYPATWARMHGKGRVFYTSMGHREDVWTNPLFQEILLGGISWAVGNVKAVVMPNIDSAAPGYKQIPPMS